MIPIICYNKKIHMNKLVKQYGLHVAWIVALLATAGSLFFSEVLKFPPCLLCWYQRIFMYPLVAILAVGIFLKDKRAHLYVLPLSIVGLSVALYHNLLYYNVVPESVAPCTIGISCTTKQIEWFGLITIPFLSLVSFAIITFCMIIQRRVKNI